MGIKEVVKLSETNKQKKLALIEEAGFKAEQIYGGYKLIDKQVNDAENYIDTYFKSLNEAVSVLSGYLMKLGYMVRA